jgi:hypothetical protein
MFLESGYRALRWPWDSREATQERRYVFSHVPLVPAPFLTRGYKQKQTALPDKRREQHEHVLEAARAAARAGREEPAPYDHGDRPTGWNDEFDNDHECDDDDDENCNADRYGRRMRHALACHGGIFTVLSCL